MHRPARLLASALCLGLTLTAPALAENWPEYRGPTGQGVYAGGGLPLEWSTTKNIAWKVPIPGKGWSSPIVWQGRIYLTTAAPVPDSKNWTLEALCLDAATGRLLWRTEVFRQDGQRAAGIHKKNSHASPSPCTDGRCLYVHFGHQGTAALGLDGKVLWRSSEHHYAPVHGNGGTPILVDDKLVFSGDGSDLQFVAALDKAIGKTIWKTDRASTAYKKFSFGTPLLITAGGKQQIISPASDKIMALEPRDGTEIWRAEYSGYSIIPRPVFGHGMVFFSTGFDQPTLLAIRVDGSGDVTKSHLAWKTAKAAPHTSSPLLIADELYMVSDSGTASCLDARTGKAHWQERIGGNFSASPLYADGKIYLQSEDGVTTVLRAGRTFANLPKASSTNAPSPPSPSPTEPSMSAPRASSIAFRRTTDYFAERQMNRLLGRSRFLIGRLASDALARFTVRLRKVRCLCGQEEHLAKPKTPRLAGWSETRSLCFSARYAEKKGQPAKKLS